MFVRYRAFSIGKLSNLYFSITGLLVSYLILILIIIYYYPSFAITYSIDIRFYDVGMLSRQ